MSANSPLRLTGDLEHIFLHTQGLWHNLNNKTIFLTGGTGFFGKWLIESFLYVNRKLGLNARMIILTRDKLLFFKNYRHITEPELSFIEGDVKDFAFPDEHIHFIIHAATEASASLNASQPLVMLDTITKGTRHVLDLAVEKKVAGFLLTSSGAVYGRQPESISHVKETDGFFIDINNPNSAYAEGKRLSELYCSIYFHHYNVPVKIARCFAFIGPFLPLDTHFAIGNFVLNALKGDDIIIKGDGSPFRSYLYAADLTIWLWTILFNGNINLPYNVGSDEDYNLKEIAELVRQTNPAVFVNIKKAIDPNKPVERYVPSIEFTKKELALDVHFKLSASIIRTIRYYGNM